MSGALKLLFWRNKIQAVRYESCYVQGPNRRAILITRYVSATEELYSMLLSENKMADWRNVVLHRNPIRLNFRCVLSNNVQFPSTYFNTTPLNTNRIERINLLSLPVEEKRREQCDKLIYKKTKIERRYLKFRLLFKNSNSTTIPMFGFNRRKYNRQTWQY